MRAFLVQRGIQLGERWKKFCAENVRDDDSLNWQTSGCFTFTWPAEGKVVSIRHSQGASVSELPVVITSAWKLECNNHDLLAGVSLGMISPRVREFFDDEVCFRSYEDSSMRNLAAEVSTKVLGDYNKQDKKGPVLQAAAKARAEKAKTRRQAPPPEKIGVPLQVVNTQ